MKKIALYTLIIAALYSCNNKKTTNKKPITALSLETTDKLSYSAVSKRERIMLNIKRKGDIAGTYYYWKIHKDENGILRYNDPEHSGELILDKIDTDN